ncbi:argonaute-like protein [Mycena metata]|uniref:Argonaute-like protein n=1 Tax=Mycena metata TaxID=1033252 RepID=A0AAD7J6V0_9AGAR|nr:argonaute-like protein [Mycena metata]
MPPRTHNRGRNRGAPGGSSAARGLLQPANQPLEAPPAHITTVGVRRPGFGRAGKTIPINVNSFTAQIPEGFIFHYDVISADEGSASPKNMQLVKELQEHIAPDVFSDARCAFDGRKNLYASVALDLGGDSREFDVILPGAPVNSNRPPKIYKVQLTLVAKINTEVLHRFVQGKQSQDSAVSTALMALNVVIRMAPSARYPFNVRSFYTPEGARNIGGGLILWRGYFQSVRPAIGRLLINPGPLISLCLSFLGGRQPTLVSRELDRGTHRTLANFIGGIRVITRDANRNPNAGTVRARVVRKLTQVGANELEFVIRHSKETRTVANHYQQVTGHPLKYPGVLCVEVGEGAWIPLELCQVIPGQLVRKEFPKEKRSDLLSFATQKPKERLASIVQGVSNTLAWSQSEYVRQFGLTAGTSPLSINARVLTPPRLTYGKGSKLPTIEPRNGSWNMADKRLYRPATIVAWILIFFDMDLRAATAQIASDFVKACRSTGMAVTHPKPIIRYINGQGNIASDIQAAGADCKAEKGVLPNLVVAILPGGGTDLYTIVKHWGDVKQGVRTQCLKSDKCKGAKMNFWTNVALKVNAKLGGISVIVDSPQTIDPHIPTVVMGADVMHPGASNRPSYAAVVSSVDVHAAKYVATLRVQASRQELISDLQEMTQSMLGKYLLYREKVEKIPESDRAPKRLVFYRDGVSEGQFQQVLERELPLIKAACEALKINPAITLVVVGKRHHVRLFPINDKDADKSGNLPAGTVVDQDIGHPTEFDFYLQSHGGILGTSRPGHYSVWYSSTDFQDNHFSADKMQAFSFALCHVYAPSTRSVSIPAPVYYADKVCARAKIHFDPKKHYEESESGTTQSSEILETYKRDFMPLHPNQTWEMYFA